MTVTAPPRPPRPSDPVDREEVEALVEALIEEARQRTRRRRRMYGAVTAVVALVGAAVFMVFDRTAQSQSASSPLASRPSPAAGTANSRIAFISGNELYIMNPDGSRQRLLARNARPAAPAWSPDARKIVFEGRRDGTHDGLHVVSVDGRERRVLAHKGRSPAWSPDGSAIAFVRSSRIYVVNPDGSGLRRLTRVAGVERYPAWSPDGRKVAFLSHRDQRCFHGGRGWYPCFDVYLVNADGSGERNLTWLLNPGGFGADPWLDFDRFASPPTWSPDGRKIAAVSTAAFGIWVLNVDGSVPHRSLLTDAPGRHAFPAWSPDARKIAFGSAGRSRCEICFEVYVMNADGSRERRLTPGSAWGPRAARPTWSPDGRKIAYISERDGNGEVYVMNADGSEQRNLTRDTGLDGFPVWSPAQK